MDPSYHSRKPQNHLWLHTAVDADDAVWSVLDVSVILMENLCNEINEVGNTKFTFFKDFDLCQAVDSSPQSSESYSEPSETFSLSESEKQNRF